MPSLFLAFGGSLILIFLTYDLFKTVVQSSEGPIARATQITVQNMILRLFHATGKRAFLAWTSSIFIWALIIIWVVLVYLGWLLIFCSDVDAVIHDRTSLPADLGERIYFVGFTISTLGVGDYIPNGYIWQFITIISALSGFILVTFMISFLISIAQQQALHRRLALQIHYIGETPMAIIEHSWNKEEAVFESEFMASLFVDLVEFQQQQIDQPILNRIHAPTKMSSVERSLIVLDEALSIMDCAVDTPMPLRFEQVRRVITDYISKLDDINGVADAEVPPLPDVEQLPSMNVPLKNANDIVSSYAEHSERRKKLNKLIQSTGWEWDSITSPVSDE